MNKMTYYKFMKCHLCFQIKWCAALL